MSFSGTASGGTRRGPGGRREVWFNGRWTPEDELTSMQLREAMKRPDVDEPGEPVRTKGKGPTKRQREVWAAVEEHGGQNAAAKALGITQGGVSSAVKGYMKAMERLGTPVEAPKPSKEGRYSPVDRHLPATSAEASEPEPEHLTPLVDVKSTGESAHERKADGQTTRPALASESVSEPADDLEEAPGEPEETMETWFPTMPELPELPLLDDAEEAVTEAHRLGYATGYAVAVLRLAASEALGFDLEVMRDMASDAADGLAS